MLARAIAKETGFRFLVVQPSVVNNKFVGESEKIIQASDIFIFELLPTFNMVCLTYE